MTPPLNLYIFDIETFPNIFTFSGKFRGKPEIQVFEISTRKNDKQALLNWLSYLQNAGVHMVGFNNLGFDYPIIHDLLNDQYTFDYNRAYQLCMQIINSTDRFSNLVRPADRIVQQIDLYTINHFDNPNKTTSLKALQFAMRAKSVEDMPFPNGTILAPEQMDILISYNIHDVTETERFLEKCIHLIEMRKELLDQGILSGDVLNFSDVKIGTEYLIKKIGRQKCFVGGKARQTFRESVEFKDIILPKIEFRTEPFEKVLDWFKAQVVYVRGKERPSLEARLANLPFFFGVGGVHASVENKKFESDAEYIIKDIDVTGMYVAVGIANGFAPEHLGQEFVVAYKQLQTDRAQYKKGTSMNKTLKLAGNGAFGNSDNHWSCFYDPRYPKQITVNGQLQILQLVEVLSLIPGIEIIQANTDGITVRMPRVLDRFFQFWKRDWEMQTGLRLEEVDYSKMWIRDVNNYLAVTTTGKIKRKGAYWFPESDEDYEGFWNKDFSSMVVQKVICEVLINGWNPEALVRLIDDPFDFMIRYKTPSGAKVYIGETEQPKTVRYYVSKTGQPMKKVSTPTGEIGQYKRQNKLQDDFFYRILNEVGPGVWDPRIHTKNKSVYEQVTTSIESKWLVKECNQAEKFDWNDVNYEYYIEEIRKLQIGKTHV